MGQVIQAREIVGAAHDCLVALVKKLPTRAKRERSWQASHHAALRRLWVQLAE